MAEGEKAREHEITAGLVGHKGEGGAGGAGGCLDDQGGPTGKAGNEAGGNGEGVFGRSIGKGLGGDDDSNPKKNTEGDLEWDETKDEPRGTGKANQGEEDSIDGRVAGASAHGFPSRMTNVDGGGKGAAEKSGKKSGESIDGEGGAGGVAIAGGISAFQILKRADDIEEGHGKDDGKESPGAFALEKGKEFIKSGVGKVETERGNGGRWRVRGEAEAVESPGNGSAKQNSGESCRNATREANFSGIGKKDKKHGEKSNGGVGIDFKNEGHGDEGEGNACERGKQGSAGKPAAERIGKEGAKEFENSTDPAGKDTSTPNKVGVMSFLPKGTHNEKKVSHEADGIDAEGEGSDVIATGAKGELPALPSIKEISHENGDGCGG